MAATPDIDGYSDLVRAASSSDEPPPSGETWAGWWLAAIVGGLVLTGAFLPFLSFAGATSVLADPPKAVAAYLVLGALLIAGGFLARTSQSGLALAGGAALTFVAAGTGVLRSAVVTISDAGDAGVDLSPHVGFVAWGLAVLGGGAVIVAAVMALRGASPARWPFSVAAGGFALLVIGLVVPREGGSVGDHLFAGDGWADASVVLLLASLIFVTVLLLAMPTPETGAFALGAGSAWFVSWCVFAFTGTTGGLPPPFPAIPLFAGLAFALISAAFAGTLWWVPGAMATTAGGALAGAQVAVIVLCGATAVVAVGGVAAADSSGTAAFSMSALAPSLASVVADASAETLAAEDAEVTGSVETVEEEEEVETEPATSAPTPAPEVTVVRCVEAFCQPHLSLSPVVDELIDASRSRDLPLTGAGQWIAQVQANAISSTDAQLRDTYASLSAQVPDLRAVYSDDFASMPSGYVIFFNAGPFRSGEEAVEYCFSLGRGDRNLCFGRFMSDDTGDNDAYVYPD